MSSLGSTRVAPLPGGHGAPRPSPTAGAPPSTRERPAAARVPRRPPCLAAPLRTPWARLCLSRADLFSGRRARRQHAPSSQPACWARFEASRVSATAPGRLPPTRGRSTAGRSSVASSRVGRRDLARALPLAPLWEGNSLRAALHPRAKVAGRGLPRACPVLPFRARCAPATLALEIARTDIHLHGVSLWNEPREPPPGWDTPVGEMGRSKRLPGSLRNQSLVRFSWLISLCRL